MFCLYSIDFRNLQKVVVSIEINSYTYAYNLNVKQHGPQMMIKFLVLNIFIAYILHAGDWATSYINIIYALSPGKYKTMS